MTYSPKNYDNLIGMKGFGEGLLKNHFTLYQGYVTNTNKAIETLDAMLKEGKTGTREFAEIKRRLGWEFNGMRLHESYFEGLGGDGKLEAGGRLAAELSAQFGGSDKWEADFRAVGGMRGIGWAALYADPAGGRLMNFWINEHDVSHPAGCNLLLIMDVFEHAYMLDYGLKRADYIEAFMKNINWGKVESRFGGMS